MAARGVRAAVKVGFLGKAKTALQMVSIVSLLYSTVGLPKSDHAMDLLCTDMSSMRTASCSPLFSSAMALFFMSVVLSLVSAGQYLLAAWPALTVSPDSNIDDLPKEKTLS